jgi:hypothetical protein
MADSGKYGCTAGNSGGFKREEVTLIVRSKLAWQYGMTRCMRIPANLMHKKYMNGQPES